MLGGLLIVALTTGIAFFMIAALKKKYPFINVPLLHKVFYFHLFLGTVYLIYAKLNPSDSIGYYERVLVGFRGNTWMDHYGTSTIFIEFVGYPFIKFLGFSYEACMALFAFFGFVGFLYTYIFFKEHIHFKHYLFGVELNTMVFFLPNLHFWSSSFGKGSIIFMGIALFFFGISNIRKRWLAILLGGLIIYHVRPHIMLVMLVSSAIGFMFSTKGVSVSLRVLFLLAAATAFYFIYAYVLSMVGIEEEEFVTQGLDLSHRAAELSKATSGVDITNYSWPMKIFTFLYRPLFIDAPGALGLIVSFENVFYLLFTLRLFTPKGIRFLVGGNFLVKTAFFSFLTVSIALAQVSGNLGLAIRQKSQVMMLFLFVVLALLDENKMKIYQHALRQRLRRASQPGPTEKMADGTFHP